MEKQPQKIPISAYSYLLYGLSSTNHVRKNRKKNEKKKKKKKRNNNNYFQLKNLG